MLAPRPRRTRRPQRQSTRAIGAPAPVSGLKVNAPIYGRAEGGWSEAVFLYNLIPGEYGCRVRPGSREFATNVLDQTAAGGEVRSLLFYTAQDGTEEVYAATDDGIYDITGGGAGAHTRSLEWGTKDATSGWVESINFMSDASTHNLLVFDETNGYYVYNGSTWSRPSGLAAPPDDPDPADLVQGVEWQNRMWFVERDTGIAWFCDTAGAFQGTMTPLNMGNRFSGGGHLKALGVWSFDAGDGMDDKLVAVSSTGDILVWELGGSYNPASASDLRLVGRWYAGDMPAGRRVLTEWGGDLLVLTSTGIVPMSALTTGANTINAESYLTRDVSRYYRTFMADRRSLYGWSMRIDPRNALAVVTIPDSAADTTNVKQQFVLNTQTGGWCMFRDLEMVSAAASAGQLWFGTTDGRVLRLNATVDDIDLAGTSSQAITFSMLTHYSHLGSPANWKRAQFIRPSWIGESVPFYAVEVRYDFDLAEVISLGPYVGPGGGSWDSAVWDDATWGGDRQGYMSTVGLLGMGRHVAIALRGETASELALVGFDLMLDQGGML